MKQGKNVVVYITSNVYSAWSRYLSAKELAMFMHPATDPEMQFESGEREDMVRLLINMPAWWGEWYKSLPREDKFRFARLVEKRLRSAGLLEA